jgi:endonuclease YncB( thermonuclease family)
MLQDIDISTVNSWKLLGKYECRVKKIYDGDTLTVVIGVYDNFFAFNVRMMGIDTPELHPRFGTYEAREDEHAAALRSRNRLIQLCSSNEVVNLEDEYTEKYIESVFQSSTKIITIDIPDERDKYGRIMGTLYDGDRNINTTLVGEGFAKLYDGKTKELWKK